MSVVLATTTCDEVSLLVKLYAFLTFLTIFFKVYQKLGYIEVVGKAAEASMITAVEEVKALPEYAANQAEVHA